MERINLVQQQARQFLDQAQPPTVKSKYHLPQMPQEESRSLGIAGVFPKLLVTFRANGHIRFFVITRSLRRLGMLTSIKKRHVCNLNQIMGEPAT